MRNRIVEMNEVEARHWEVLSYCLRERRKKAGWTQEHLAAEAGLSTSEIQHIEHGRRHPTTGTQTRLCCAFGISHLELMAEVNRVAGEELLAVSGG